MNLQPEDEDENPCQPYRLVSWVHVVLGYVGGGERALAPARFCIIAHNFLKKLQLFSSKRILQLRVLLPLL